MSSPHADEPHVSQIDPVMWIYPRLRRIIHFHYPTTTLGQTDCHFQVKIILHSVRCVIIRALVYAELLTTDFDPSKPQYRPVRDDDTYSGVFFGPPIPNIMLTHAHLHLCRLQ